MTCPHTPTPSIDTCRTRRRERIHLTRIGVKHLPWGECCSCGRVLPPREKAAVAQKVERPPCKRVVPGPIPGVGSKKNGRATGKAAPQPAIEWRPVEGYDGYSVSSAGSVRNSAGKILKPQFSERAGGYPFINLCRCGQRKNANIHTLVAAAFLGPLPAGKVVHHKDGDRTNPSRDNLEHVTHAENAQHREVHRKATPQPIDPTVKESLTVPPSKMGRPPKCKCGVCKVPNCGGRPKGMTRQGEKRKGWPLGVKRGPRMVAA